MRQTRRYLAILANTEMLSTFYQTSKECLKIFPGDFDEAYQADSKLLQKGKASSEAVNVVYRTSVCASGPVLTAYIYWVLTRAYRQGIQRLYFLDDR